MCGLSYGKLDPYYKKKSIAENLEFWLVQKYFVFWFTVNSNLEVFLISLSDVQSGYVIYSKWVHHKLDCVSREVHLVVQFARTWSSLFRWIMNCSWNWFKIQENPENWRISDQLLISLNHLKTRKFRLEGIQEFENQVK